MPAPLFQKGVGGTAGDKGATRNATAANWGLIGWNRLGIELAAGRRERPDFGQTSRPADHVCSHSPMAALLGIEFPYPTDCVEKVSQINPLPNPVIYN
jgi:hypothetical protein